MAILGSTPTNREECRSLAGRFDQRTKARKAIRGDQPGRDENAEYLFDFSGEQWCAVHHLLEERRTSFVEEVENGAGGRRQLGFRWWARQAAPCVEVVSDDQCNRRRLERPALRTSP